MGSFKVNGEFFDHWLGEALSEGGEPHEQVARLGSINHALDLLQSNLLRNLDLVLVLVGEVRFYQDKEVRIHEHVTNQHLLLKTHIAKNKLVIGANIVGLSLLPVEDLPVFSFDGKFF